MIDNSIQNANQLYINSNKSFNIVSKDEFKSYMHKSILNLSNEGTHWVSMNKLGSHHFFYDDPFGIVPPDLKIKNSLIEYDPYQDQKIYETNCGKRAFNSLI